MYFDLLRKLVGTGEDPSFLKKLGKELLFYEYCFARYPVGFSIQTKSNVLNTNSIYKLLAGASPSN